MVERGSLKTMSGKRGINRWDHNGGRSKPKPETIIQVLEMRRHGCTVREVAEYFSVSKTTIENWIRQALKPKPVEPQVPHYSLERDMRVGLLIERRRWDCLRLRQCEAEWIETQGARQAMCPAGCPGVSR